MLLMVDPSGHLDTTQSAAARMKILLMTLFRILVQIGDSNYINDVRVNVILDKNDYYYYDWNINKSPQFILGIDSTIYIIYTTISFTRAGTNTALDWTKVQSIEITATFTREILLFLAGGGRIFNSLGVHKEI